MTLKRLAPAMLIGLLAVLIIALLFSFIISIILAFTSLTENSFTWLIIGASFFSLFVGGLVAGVKAKGKGWLAGAGTAILFSFIAFLVQYLGYHSGFSAEQYLFHGGYMLSAILGGVIGVNIISR